MIPRIMHTRCPHRYRVGLRSASIHAGRVSLAHSTVGRRVHRIASLLYLVLARTSNRHYAIVLLSGYTGLSTIVLICAQPIIVTARIYAKNQTELTSREFCLFYFFCISFHVRQHRHRASFRFVPSWKQFPDQYLPGILSIPLVQPQQRSGISAQNRFLFLC